MQFIVRFSRVRAIDPEGSLDIVGVVLAYDVGEAVVKGVVVGSKSEEALLYTVRRGAIVRTLPNHEWVELTTLGQRVAIYRTDPRDDEAVSEHALSLEVVMRRTAVERIALWLREGKHSPTDYADMLLSGEFDPFSGG